MGSDGLPRGGFVRWISFRVQGLYLNSFFFSSRRRHTRLTCDWSSDVCSSDLCPGPQARWLTRQTTDDILLARSEERRVGKSVDLGGRRIIKKKNKYKIKRK